MGELLLFEAVQKNIPLAEFTIEFFEGIDYEAATLSLNSLAEDFHLLPKPWYNRPRLRIGSATKEALERLFDWRLRRVPLERFDKVTGKWGHWPNFYRWDVVSPPSRYPMEGIIEQIALSQPGADDNGQWYE